MSIKNLAFVAREYFRDCNDEIVESRDGLYDDFGGDNYCVTRNAFYLGLTRGNNGCEPLEEETDEEYEARVYEGMDEDEGDDEYVYFFVRDQDKARVAEAVNETLALQKFFRKQTEKRELEVEVVERFRAHYRFDGQSAQNTYRPLVRRKNGRPLGNHGSHGCAGADISFHELVPIEVLLDNPASTNARRLRIG